MKAIGFGVVVFLIIAGIFWTSENIMFRKKPNKPVNEPENEKGEN